MFIALLGRQPELSLAELEAVFGRYNVNSLSDTAALIHAEDMRITDLGGTIKCGKVIHQYTGKTSDMQAISSWVLRHYSALLSAADGKITLGISAYGLPVSARQVQKIGLLLKSSLKKRGVNVRLIPNTEPSLSTATSHNNKLGLSPKKIEILLVRAKNGTLYIAESRGAQNITAYARRDRERPRRDAFVGMLPPKLAQIMINLAIGPPAQDPHGRHILDPFCGTGTVLQEALLKGYCVHGSDLSQKMVDYTIENLGWLQQTHKHTGTILSIRQGDATQFTWVEAHFLDAVVCETYLGQPFSAPPHPDKLTEVVGNCNHIISGFLRNIHDQLTPSTPLCIAVPAWRHVQGQFTHLPLLKQLEALGYRLQRPPLLYYRPNQIVAREILLLKTA